MTIIPLNKIAARSIRPEMVSKAKQLVGEDNVEVALSLVGYDGEVQKAMEYVFGGTFVCPDIGSAEKVTFHKDIRTRSVTYVQQPDTQTNKHKHKEKKKQQRAASD